MALSQMNIRIDEDVRIEGNLALESIGLTPSQAVRNMWGFAAANRSNPEKLRRTLKALEKPSSPDAERKQRRRLIEEGWRIVPDGLAAMGVVLPPCDDTPYAELKDRAYRNYWTEKGVL